MQLRPRNIRKMPTILIIDGRYKLFSILGNKRHTLYNTQLAVVNAQPSKDPPSNLPRPSAIQDQFSMSSKEVDPAGTQYKVQSVTKKTSRTNGAKGTMYALLSESTMASKKTSYSEKVRFPAFQRGA